MCTTPQYTGNPALVSADLARLFPPGVVVAELRRAGDPELLLPAEAPFVRQAVPKRVREFAAGRLCARRALEEFGVHGFPLCVGEDRQPIWPERLVGSITHTAGFCAAAVAERSKLMAVGMDSETVGDVTRDIWPTICGASEAAWIRSLPAAAQDAAVTLIFSAKEAFYKCQYPLTHEWLDFHDLIVEPLGVVSAAAAAGPQADAQATDEVSVTATRRIAFSDHARLPMSGRYRFHERFVSVGFGVPA